MKLLVSERVREGDSTIALPLPISFQKNVRNTSAEWGTSAHASTLILTVCPPPLCTGLLQEGFGRTERGQFQQEGEGRKKMANSIVGNKPYGAG